jgi:hypothetical protein
MENALQAANRYIFTHVNYFAVPKDTVEVEQLKPFFELVFFYNMLPSHVRLDATWQAMRDYIFRQIEQHDFTTKLRQNIDLLSGVAILEQFLLLHERSHYRAILLHTVAEHIDLAHDKLPFRQIDVKYSLEQAQINNRLASYEQLFAASVLGKDPSPYYLTWLPMYSITHTIFYLTDMGRSRKYATLLSDKIELLQHLLTENIRNNNLDILAEVVISCFFLGLHTQPIIRPLLTYACRCMCERQRTDGAFPAPTEQAHNEHLTQQAAFQLRYHTTLVCIGALIWHIEKII